MTLYPHGGRREVALMISPGHIDYADPKYRAAAAEILRRQTNFETEANITSAVRNFLTTTGLVKDADMVAENPPADASRQAVDLTALDTFIEFKRRIGGATAAADAGEPNPEYVAQLDDYLTQSEKRGRVRMGILTDGRHWLLRWPGAGPVRLTRPYSFTLKDADKWYLLFEWLRDYAIVPLENLAPDQEGVAAHFGLNNPNYQRDIAALKTLYQDNAGQETIRVKRRLWQDLLRTALGEIAHSPEQMDDLFLRHTYLSAVIGMVVQASFGIDLRQLADNEPEDLLYGRRFRTTTTLQGVVESHFFTWPAEMGGRSILQTLARRVVKFDWLAAPADIGAIFYQTVIPPEERRQLGEYYTPDWLAQIMVQELVTDPLQQRVLDPACGSGTFVAAGVTHFINAALPEGQPPRLAPQEILDRLREAVTGIDVHPVAVHLARSAWALAARPAIAAARAAGFSTALSIPVYLGDALQLRFRAGDLFAEQEVTIQAQDEENTELVFPVSLVEHPEQFDALMLDIADCIEQGDDPFLALDDNHIADAGERKILRATIAAMQKLHQQGRNHIWAYYTRNMVRPVALARRKVDVVIGNPPWINYNQTADVLRVELENLSKERYGIWAGGRYASNQDIAGLFFTRCVDLYLGQQGVIGFVMPHSTLQSGQHSRWRTGLWQSPPTGRGRERVSEFTLSVEFNHRRAWDLERLNPNTFFPVAACVVFARCTGSSGIAAPLAGPVEVWQGPAGSEPDRRELRGLTDTSTGVLSPYDGYSGQGASLRPRRFFFVQETENPSIVPAGQTITVNPRRGTLDKTPWRSLDLTAITEQTIEDAHLFEVHLGETIAPYVALTPLKALLPLRQGEYAIPVDANGPGGIRLGGLARGMRRRWQTINRWWEEYKAPVNKLNLRERLDYHSVLSSQLNWQRSHDDRPIRVVQTAAGQPTAAILPEDAVLVDETLYWITCKNLEEANYLLGIINSAALYASVQPLMSKGQYGARSLHKHLWKLPIPEFDPRQKLHMVIAKAGERAAAGAAQKLAEVREQRGRQVSVTIIRRELRAWLRSSAEGKEVEAAVAALLGQGVDFRGTITIEEGKRFGKPCIRGIRMTAMDVMEYLAGGETWAGFLEDFDNLTEADLYACLSFAAAEQMDDDYSRLRYAVI